MTETFADCKAVLFTLCKLDKKLQIEFQIYLNRETLVNVAECAFYCTYNTVNVFQGPVDVCVLYGGIIQ